MSWNSINLDQDQRALPGLSSHACRRHCMLCHHADGNYLEIFGGGAIRMHLCIYLWCRIIYTLYSQYIIHVYLIYGGHRSPLWKFANWHLENNLEYFLFAWAFNLLALYQSEYPTHTHLPNPSYLKLTVLHSKLHFLVCYKYVLLCIFLVLW